MNKCYWCVGECLAAKGVNSQGVPPAIDDAITMVPSWQKLPMGNGQTAMACVVLPACARHYYSHKTIGEHAPAGSGLLVAVPQ